MLFFVFSNPPQNDGIFGSWKENEVAGFVIFIVVFLLFLATAGGLALLGNN